MRGLVIRVLEAFQGPATPPPPPSSFQFSWLTDISFPTHPPCLLGGAGVRPLVRWGTRNSLGRLQMTPHSPLHSVPPCPAPTAITSTLRLLNGSESTELFTGSREPRPHCIRCAVVGNGGILNGSRQGRNIDAHDYVFRYVRQGPGRRWEGSWAESWSGASPWGSIFREGCSPRQQWPQAARQL